MEEKWEKTRRGKQRTRYPRDVARCDVGEMSFLERVDGRERVWNRTKKPAGAEALSRWKKTSVTAPAASTTYSFFFLQFLLQLLQLLLPEFSSFPSFPLLLIVVYSYFLHFHLHLDLPPHCSFSTMLLEFFSLISAIRWCLSSSSLCVISFFFFFLSFHFFSFFFLILFLPSFISTFDFFSYQQARTPSSIRVSPRFSLLILLYVSRLLNQDARSRCLHNNFPNKAEVVFGIWNGVLWYARGSRINCYGIYVILINV